MLAHTDPLTGLTNRRGFEIELEGLLSDPVGAGHAALFFLDLNGFKLVNDRLGHRAGDDALRVIADRLRSLTRAHDTVARVGGDEFVILARQVGADPAAAQLAERFGQALLRPPGAPDVVVRASVGVAVPQAGDTAQALIERADRAMYAAKRDQGTVSDERP